MSILKTNKNLIAIVVLYLGNIALQNYNLGKTVNVFTDEGVYLYSAKLIFKGLLPFKDFFLAQPPFLLYLVGFLQWVTTYNMDIFRFIYTLWVFSSVFPIFFVVLKITKNSLAAVLSIIFFSTFPELVQWDMHSFAYRQASLPFLAFGIFFILVKPKKLIAGILLGLFSISIISNVLITICLMIPILLEEYLIKRVNISQAIKNQFPILLPFFIITILGYLTIFLLPQGYPDLIGYQLQRPFLSLSTRIEWIKTYSLNTNWPILTFGLIGSIIINKKAGLFGLFNILSILTVIFLSRSYYPHYLTILAVGLSISCGVLFSYLTRTFATSIISTLLVILVLYNTSYHYLKSQLIDRRTPDFFSIVDRLRNLPAPLFTFEPIYGLYAKKDLSFHYNAADMRYFRVMGKNMEEENYLKIINNSSTILIEPFASTYLNQTILNYINKSFEKQYDDGTYSIYVKNI